MSITAITWLCGFLRMSTTTGLSAQAFGKNDNELNSLILLRGIIVAFTIGFTVIALQVFYLDFALSLAGGFAASSILCTRV